MASGMLRACSVYVLALSCSLLASISNAEAVETVFLVHLEPSVGEIISQIDHVSRHELYSSIQESIQLSQETVQAHVLRAYPDVQIEPLWISNTLVLRTRPDGFESSDLFYFLHELAEVTAVEQDSKALYLSHPVQDIRQRSLQGEELKLTSNAQSNIRAIGAERLWEAGITGRNIVVANIDSGVRYTHEALWSSYRGNCRHATAPCASSSNYTFDYSFWFTPSTKPSDKTPDNVDVVGHGTHTMGTAVGSLGIGVAPDATWITAKAFDIQGACNKSDFLHAAQWVLCPTKSDGSDSNCTLGAHVISNSFGVSPQSPAYDDWKWLDEVLDVWDKAGLVAVFASGNTNGFECSSVFYPGARRESIAVGALIGQSTLWGGSGKGPAINMSSYAASSVIKPDFVTPGFAIRSALSVSDTYYARLTGTSMATPHVSGAIALLLSGNLSLDASSRTKIVESLIKTAGHGLHKPFLVPSSCGATTYDKYPNNIYGWGLPHVCRAADALGIHCRTNGKQLEEDE